MTDAEQKILEEVAKAQGKPLAQLLLELGKDKPALSEDSVVEFQGVPESQPTAVEAPIPEISPEPPPFAEDIPQEADPQTEETRTLGTLPSVCVHCGWDQSQPTIPEPESQDKQGFLQSVLGLKVFSKTYTLLGGALQLTFRSLTVKELDALYSAAFAAQKTGLITIAADYYEYLNRLRLCLQLQKISSTRSALHISLPPGLTRSANPHAAGFWDEFLAEKQKAAGAENSSDSWDLLTQVQQYVMSEALSTESLQRVVTHACANFNRLVVKLEACVDDANFWNETAPPS